MRTFGQIVDEAKGIGSGFDLLRLFAASMVLVSHAYPLTFGSDAIEPVFVLSHGQMTLGRIAVGLFFSTSGFLVTASLLRSESILDFGWRRAVRILPALWVVVAVCALVVGPIFTRLALPAYFSDPGTYHYAFNAIFLTTYPALPGVFGSNPMGPPVNGSLWTLIYEVGSYVSLSALGFLGLYRWRLGFLIGILALIGVTFMAPNLLHGRLRPFSELFVYFGIGSLIYLYRQYLWFSAGLAALAGLCIAASLMFGGAMIVVPIALGYIAIWFGFQKVTFKLQGDYSYGVYLWAFPIQQMLEASMPGLTPVRNIILALPLALLAGFLSWNGVEKPALKLKGLALTHIVPAWKTTKASIGFGRIG